MYTEFTQIFANFLFKKPNHLKHFVKIGENPRKIFADFFFSNHARQFTRYTFLPETKTRASWGLAEIDFGQIWKISAIVLVTTEATMLWFLALEMT